MRIYQVDAFASEIFKGNPAGVCPLEKWPSDEIMQNIAMENNLAETAFFVPNEKGFHLRWFTPALEIPLCGHATLASAHVLYNHLNYRKDEIIFDSLSGELIVKKVEDKLQMDFPTRKLIPLEITNDLTESLGEKPLELFKMSNYWLAIVENEKSLAAINPDMRALKNFDFVGICVSAPGDEVDFVSRFFAPTAGIDEDPVTGSSHTGLAPYWAKKLNKTKMQAKQISKRGGDLEITFANERTLMSGKAKTFMEGEIFV